MKKIFTESKLRIVMASAVTIILIILTILAVNGDGMHIGKLVLSLLLSVAAGVSIALKFKLPKPAGIAALIVIPILALCTMEFYTHVPWDLTVLIFILNMMFYYLLYAICTFLLGSTRWGYMLATAIPMFFGVANYFVVSFRSSPIVPWDFMSLGTAITITDNYTFTFSYRLVFVLIGFIFLMILGEKTVFSVKNIKVRLIALLLSAILMTGYVTSVKTDTVKDMFGLDDILFTPNVLYRNNGFMVAFLANLRYLDIEKPEGYSTEEVTKIEQEIEKEKASSVNASASDTEKQKKPNIVVIMNEAFTDLAYRGDFETNEDYMPFIRSMEENTIKADMFVSVKGGNTANTEFEFLTGDSMAFLPTGSVAYQQYVKGNMPTLASYLKGMGYSTTAIHPYYATGWSRDKVYSYFGFDQFYSKDDFDNPETIRGYVSDKSAFDKIIETYENKTPGEPMFTFEVTMQNHGGYSKEYPGFEPSIELTQIPEEEKTLSVVSTERYLTLVKETDKAFEELINYFSNVDEDTIVVMFGDHQPSDYIANAILRLNDIDQESSIEEFQNGYKVPMVMWANYDIEEQDINRISVNYLSGLLMEQAGLPLTDYQTYLQSLRKTLPVITANIYIDKDGQYYEYSDEPYQDLLNQYSILQYNHLCDNKNRIDKFFGG